MLIGRFHRSSAGKCMRSFRIASLAIVLISSEASASTLYAVSNNTLRIIDQVTASQTLVGSLDPFGFVLGGAVVVDMTSDIRPDSFRLWAVSPNLPGRLVRINPVTGAATVVGPSINNTPLSMVAFDSITGKLYGMARPNPNLGNDQLYLVNPDTAATAPIGTGVGAGIDFNSLGFDNTGDLYAIRNFTTRRDVYRISTTTGLATFVAQTNLPDNVFDIATRPEDGVTFASVVNSVI